MVLSTLDTHIELHAYSVYYWSSLGRENPDECFRITSYLRGVLERHRIKLEDPKKPFI